MAEELRDSSPVVTVDIDKLPSLPDFLAVVKAIVKFLISQKSQIPSAWNYDSMKRSSEAVHSEDFAAESLEKQNGQGEISSCRLRKRKSRLKERNKVIVKQYVEKMEALFKNISDAFEMKSGHLELVILLGGSLPTSKDIITIKIPTFSRSLDESMPLRRLLSKVLSGLMSNVGSVFFAQKVPLTYLHACLKTSQLLPYTQLQGQIGNSRSRRLNIEFVIRAPVTLLKTLDDDVDIVTENLGNLIIPEDSSQVRKTIKKKPVRRLMFSTPKAAESSPVLSRPCSRLSGIANISGISVLGFAHDDTHPLDYVDNQELTFYYRLGVPVKGLKLVTSAI